MSDSESLRADAREMAAEERVRRVNTRRSATVNSASLEPPEYVCEDCGLDGDCQCFAEVAEVKPKQGGNTNESHPIRVVAQPREQAHAVGSARQTRQG